MNLCDSCIHSKMCRFEVPDGTNCDEYLATVSDELHARIRALIDTMK